MLTIAKRYPIMRLLMLALLLVNGRHVEAQANDPNAVLQARLIRIGKNASEIGKVSSSTPWSLTRMLAEYQLHDELGISDGQGHALDGLGMAAPGHLYSRLTDEDPFRFPQAKLDAFLPQLRRELKRQVKSENSQVADVLNASQLARLKQVATQHYLTMHVNPRIAFSYHDIILDRITATKITIALRQLAKDQSNELVLFSFKRKLLTIEKILGNGLTDGLGQLHDFGLPLDEPLATAYRQGFEGAKRNVGEPGIVPIQTFDFPSVLDALGLTREQRNLLNLVQAERRVLLKSVEQQDILGVPEERQKLHQFEEESAREFHTALTAAQRRRANELALQYRLFGANSVEDIEQLGFPLNDLQRAALVLELGSDKFKPSGQRRRVAKARISQVKLLLRAYFDEPTIEATIGEPIDFQDLSATDEVDHEAAFDKWKTHEKERSKKFKKTTGARRRSRGN